jgi:membrane protease YdiL (CAAX protease family)
MTSQVDSEMATRKRDFPFYNGKPVSVPGWKWALIILGILAGFAFLAFAPKPGGALVAMALGATVFVGIPLLVYAALVRPGWTAIFRRIRPIDVLFMVVFAAANQAVGLLLGLLFAQALGANASPTGDMIEAMPVYQRLLFFPATGVSLFGEELFSVLLFLAVLWLCAHKFGFPRAGSIAIAVIAAAIVFGLIHLPTYDYNLAQVLVFISLARVILFIPWLLTKNIWVSTGAHILNDWSTFAFVAIVTPLPLVLG